MGDRFLHRTSYSSRLIEDSLVERSPSGDHLKLCVVGWMSLADLRSRHQIVEVLGPRQDPEDPEEMCPNCVTPWKCNGPHLLKPRRNAPSGSPELERHMEDMGL